MISVILKVTISITAALVVAALLVPTSAPLYANIGASFANVTPSFFGKSRVQPDSTNQSIPADTETFTAADKQQPAPNQMGDSAPTEPVVDKVESQSGVLFRQFQAWAAAQANVGHAQPDQDVKVAQTTPAKLAAPQPVAQKRQNPPVVVSNAPTKARSPHKPSRPLQNAQMQIPPSLSAERQRTLRSEQDNGRQPQR